MPQKTLAIIKPCVQGVALQTQVLADFLAFIADHKCRLGGLVFSKLTPEIVDSIYRHVASKPFFLDMLTLFVTRRSFVLTVYGENAIEVTNKAKAHIRRAYSDKITHSYANFVHCSDSAESAEYELKLFGL